MYPVPHTSKPLFQILHHTLLQTHTEYTISLLFPPVEQEEEGENADRNREEEDGRKKREKEGGGGNGEVGTREEVEWKGKGGGRRSQDEVGEGGGKQEKNGREEEKKEEEGGGTKDEEKRKNMTKEEGGIILMKTRYSELLSLHQELKKEYGGEHLPPFPPKKCLGNQKEDFLERRKRLLVVYFNRLALTVDLRKEKIIKRFIDNHQEAFKCQEKLLKLGKNQLQSEEEKTITIETNKRKAEEFEKRDEEGKGL